MKVTLISSLQVFPPRSGGQSRTASLAQSLASKGFEVNLFSIIGRKEDLIHGDSGYNNQAPNNVREFVARPRFVTILGIFLFKLGLPPVWATLWLLITGRNSKSLKELLSSSHVIIADFPFTYPVFTMAKRISRGQQVPLLVLNTHNVEHHLVSSRLNKAIVRHIENLASNQSELILVCSENDRSYFTETSDKRSLLIPNGINIENFNRSLYPREEIRRNLGLDDKKVFLYAASSYGPNIDGLNFIRHFCERNKELLNELKIHFLVVGSVSSKTERGDVLSTLGKVEQIEPFFAAADFAVNPIFEGSGTSVKVAQYLAARLPILTTQVGARGYSLLDQQSCFYFDRENFKQKLLDMINHSNHDSLSMLAFAENQKHIDMNLGITPLYETILHENRV